MRIPAARLAVLARLSRLRADLELARLAATAQSRARLRAALAELGHPEPPLDPPQNRSGITSASTGSAGATAGQIALPVRSADSGACPLRIADDATANEPETFAARHGAATSTDPKANADMTAPVAVKQVPAAQVTPASARPAPTIAPPVMSEPVSDAAATALIPSTPSVTAPTTSGSETAGDAIGPVHLMRMRLAHAAWVAARRTEINRRLALVEADWLRLYPPAVRAFGRAEVLRKLASTAQESARRDLRQGDGA